MERNNVSLHGTPGYSLPKQEPRPTTTKGLTGITTINSPMFTSSRSPQRQGSGSVRSPSTAIRVYRQAELSKVFTQFDLDDSGVFQLLQQGWGHFSGSPLLLPMDLSFDNSISPPFDPLIPRSCRRDRICRTVAHGKARRAPGHIIVLG